MSSAVRKFHPIRQAFRLSPLVMALALISPFHANAADLDSLPAMPVTLWLFVHGA